MYICIYTYMYTYIYIYIYVTYMCICRYVHASICMCTHVYAYIYFFAAAYYVLFSYLDCYIRKVTAEPSPPGPGLLQGLRKRASPGRKAESGHKSRVD